MPDHATSTSRARARRVTEVSTGARQVGYKEKGEPTGTSLTAWLPRPFTVSALGTLSL